MATMRDRSRENWAGDNSLEKINAGSLQRIADATEKMAQNWDSLTRDRDLYKRWYEEGRARAQRLEHRIRALRGALTKAKRARKGR